MREWNQRHIEEIVKKTATNVASTVLNKIGGKAVNSYGNQGYTHFYAYPQIFSECRIPVVAPKGSNMQMSFGTLGAYRMYQGAAYLNAETFAYAVRASNPTGDLNHRDSRFNTGDADGGAHDMAKAIWGGFMNIQSKPEKDLPYLCFFPYDYKFYSQINYYGNKPNFLVGNEGGPKTEFKISNITAGVIYNMSGVQVGSFSIGLGVPHLAINIENYDLSNLAMLLTFTQWPGTGRFFYMLEYNQAVATALVNNGLQYNEFRYAVADYKPWLLKAWRLHFTHSITSVQNFYEVADAGEAERI